jgi:glycerophosphoryl diester phosphodiesterase
MKNHFSVKILLFFLSIALVQCSKSGNKGVEEPNQEITANFTTSINQATVNSAVVFTGSSSETDNNIVSWQWDFADGTPLGTQKNVTHQFVFGGSYLVKLTVKNAAGKTAVFSKRLLVKNTGSPNYGSLMGLKEKIALLYPKVMVAAHRAYHKNYPENSIEAINDAILNKINIVEIDTRFTLDKELVLMHDATTARTANANYIVSQRTFSELRQLKLLFNGIPSNYVIPTLKESLEAAKGKVYVDIDASWDTSVEYYNKIYNTIAALNMVNMVMIYTESPAVAKGLLDIDSDVIVLLGAGSVTDYNNALAMNPKAALWHMSSGTLSPNYTNWPTNNGIKLWANAYVNSTNSPPLTGADAVVNNLLNNQISLIQTDYPLEIISYLQGKNQWLQ